MTTKERLEKFMEENSVYKPGSPLGIKFLAFIESEKAIQREEIKAWLLALESKVDENALWSAGEKYGFKCAIRAMKNLLTPNHNGGTEPQK